MVLGLEKRVGSISLMDALLIAATKQVEERMLTRLIGNGTLFSGAVKSVLGIVLNGAVKGKVGDIVGTAFIVDGAEDVVTAFLGGGGTRSLTGRSTNDAVRIL